MGFKSSKSGERSTKGIEALKHDSNRNFFMSLYDEYLKNEKLRSLFIETNKDKKKDTAIESIKKLAVNLFSKEECDTLAEYLDVDKTYPFGYILEYMTAFKLLSVVENHIADMNASVFLKFADEKQHKKSGGYPTDEFDIALLTRTGQLIIIECKSGKMSGDVGKSTKYSTYAAAGVYGLPVLVTPFK